MVSLYCVNTITWRYPSRASSSRASVRRASLLSEEQRGDAFEQALDLAALLEGQRARGEGGDFVGVGDLVEGLVVGGVLLESRRREGPGQRGVAAPLEGRA